MINLLFDIFIYVVIIIVLLVGIGKAYFIITDRILFKDLTEWNKKRKRKNKQ